MSSFYLKLSCCVLLSVAVATIPQAVLSADDVEEAEQYGIAFIVFGTEGALKTFQDVLENRILDDSGCKVKKDVELKKLPGFDVKVPKKTFGSHPDVYSCAKTSGATFSAFGSALIATLGKGEFVIFASTGCPTVDGTRCAKYCSGDGDQTCYKRNDCVTACRR